MSYKPVRIADLEVDRRLVALLRNPLSEHEAETESRPPSRATICRASEALRVGRRSGSVERCPSARCTSVSESEVI